MCQDLEADVRDTKILIYNIANSYRKGKTDIYYSIKAKESEDILTVQGRSKLDGQNTTPICSTTPLKGMKRKRTSYKGQ